MSKLVVEKNGKPVVITDEYQTVWKKVEDTGIGLNDLLFVDATDEFPSDTIQVIAHFLGLTGEMFGARLDDFKYVFGDVDCCDMEEWEEATIVYVSVED